MLSIESEMFWDINFSSKLLQNKPEIRVPNWHLLNRFQQIIHLFNTWSGNILLGSFHYPIKFFRLYCELGCVHLGFRKQIAQHWALTPVLQLIQIIVKSSPQQAHLYSTSSNSRTIYCIQIKKGRNDFTEHNAHLYLISSSQWILISNQEIAK